MQTTTERASIVITESSRTRTPRPAKTVSAPKASGIAAAISERKTSSRTMSRERRGDQLGALGRVQRFGLQRPRDAGVAGLGRFQRRVDVSVEGAFERRHGVAHGDVERQAVVEQDERPAGAGAQRADGAAVPGGDGGRRGSRRSAPTSAGPWRSIAAARPAQQDREGRGVAEVLFGESLAAGRGGARHDQRGRLEPVFDAEPGDAEGPAADQDDDQADDGRAKPRLTRAPPHGGRSLRRLHYQTDSLANPMSAHLDWRK